MLLPQKANPAEPAESSRKRHRLIICPEEVVASTWELSHIGSECSKYRFLEAAKLKE